MALLAGVHNQYVTHMVAVMSHWGPSGRPDVEGDVHVSTRDIPPGTERTEERKTFELPMSYFNDLADYSGLDVCNKPKLFFAGLKDVLITPDEVKEMVDDATEPKQYLELDSEHDYRLHAEIIDEVNKKVEAFIKNN
jgi:hypothetical protein